MASSDYKRVSRKRACRICGKTDWCSYTPDEKISFCAREISGSDRTSRTGWGVFYHEKTLFQNNIEPPFAPRRRERQSKPELAPIEIRDFAYRKLIELAPATNSKEIIDGPKGLRLRNILDFENYGALPQSCFERHHLAKEIRCLINREFPGYVRQRKSAVNGLPGFWLDKDGKTQLWLNKDYSCPMMIIPYRAANGLVQACQIRFVCRRLNNNDVRYVWLSTPENSGGLSCGSPLHFALYDVQSFNKPVLITEGALKAATVCFFRRDYDVLASAGVTCSHREIVRATRHRPILIAFDADYYENVYVARAFAKLISSKLSSTETEIQNKVKILTWNPRIKGIDDALLRNTSIDYQSPSEWYKSLSGLCQIEAAKILPNELIAATLQKANVLN